MKCALSRLAVVPLAVLLSAEARFARAAEGPGDVETDHIDAADDGGPRTVGVLLHPLEVATGWLGAEVDVACSEHVVFSAEGDGRWFFGGRGARVLLGMALFPQRFSFHGIYVHPTFEWDRSSAGAVVASALGGGVAVGYAWTFLVGPTVRLGGGIAYSKGSISDGQGLLAREGLRPEVDGDVGWVF